MGKEHKRQQKMKVYYNDELIPLDESDLHLKERDLGIRGSDKKLVQCWLDSYNIVNNKVIILLQSHFYITGNISDFKIKIELNDKVVFNTYEMSREQVESYVATVFIIDRCDWYVELNKYVACSIKNGKNDIFIKVEEQLGVDTTFKVWVEEREKIWQ
jgi:hypothetical protein